MNRPELLRAGWVLPIEGDPIADAAVAVSEGRVVWVGLASDSGRPGWPVRDMGPGVLLPGLVNAHTHLELSALAGSVSGARGFTEWVRALVEARPGVAPEDARAAARDAIAGLEAAGTMAVGDVSNSLEHLDLLGQASIDAVVFYEQLAWDPARAGEVLERADLKLRGLALPANVEVRLAAHAPHSVSAALMRGLVARGGPAALHLAESPDESRFLRSGDGPWREFLLARVGNIPFDAPGQSPVAYVEGLGALHPGLLAAHCVQLDAPDIARLASRRVSVVACPRSNRALGLEVPPVPELLAAGVNVALGTDSLASAPSLDVLDDAVALAREFPSLAAGAILRAATLGGARALGRGELGSIAPGRRAALVFAPAPVDLADPEGFLLSGRARLRRVA